MAAQSYRGSNEYRPNVNLYCAQCESQLGIFDNEWIRLTSSYARAKEKATHFGTEVGNRTQVVPSGAAQRSAEGCVMAEVFCRKCSNMVGQYCKSAPDTEKQPLVNQYFYKLTRTFLKDSRTNVRVDPLFGYGSDIVKPSSSRSSMMPRSSATPTSRWANTPLRQSSRTPAVSTDRLNHNLAPRDLVGSPTILTDPQNDGWEASAEVQKLQEKVAMQQVAIKEQSGKILSLVSRLDQQEQRAKHQDASIEEHENCLSAQATRIVEQEEVIKDQTKRFEMQQLQMSTITRQLSKLQESMDGLKASLLVSRQNSAIQHLTTTTHANTDGNIETIMTTIRDAQNRAKELEALRVENRSMKSRLSTIANAMGVDIDASASEARNESGSVPTVSDAAQILGKRKRVDIGQPSTGLEEPIVQDNATKQLSSNTEQMPTPQSSDGGQSSPMQPPRTVLNRPNNELKGTQQRKGLRRKPSRTSLVDESDLSSKQAEGKRVENTPGSDRYLNSPALDSSLQYPPSRNQRATSSVTAVRRRSRLSRTSDVIEVVDLENDSTMIESPDVGSRRITRATSRAIRAGDLDGGLEPHPVETDVQVINPVTFSPEIQDQGIFHVPVRSHARQSLPSVQEASSILGMNLEALIASSQALTRDINTRMSDLDTIPNSAQSLRNVVSESRNDTVNPADSRHPTQIPNEITNSDLPSPCPHTSQTSSETNGIEIVQFSGVFDVIDSSDDEEDELMQPDAALYGDDFYDGENVSLPEWDNTFIADADRASYLSSTMDRTVVRQERSMAPEPIKRKRTNNIRYNVDMDRIYIATPQMFREAYAAGRKPKEVRARVWTGRERDLNNELIQLGLSHWIGKSKNCKEYRDAVSAARAHFRNYNKAAYLWSKGLNHKLSDPSSALPVSQLPRPEGASQIMPLSDIHNVPAPLPSVSDAIVLSDQPDQDEDEDEANKDPPRTTRASTRRSSVSLVSGLEEAESHTTGVEAKQTRAQRKSTGRRQSKRKSDLVREDADEPDVEIVQALGDDDPVSTNPNAGLGALAAADMADAAGGLVSQRPKTSGRPRGRPRKWAVLESQEQESTVQNKPHLNGHTHPEDLQPESLLTPTVLIPDGITDTEMFPDEEIQPQPTSTKSLAELQEEAIMRRDRMAKALMESEDWDV